MRTNFLNKVAAMSGKNVNELVGMSQNEVVNKVILPIIVQPTGQDIRGWRIGDDYMSLMAEFGEYCWQQDAFTGEILLELPSSAFPAVQFFTKPAVTKFCPKHIGNIPQCVTSRV